MNIDGAYVRWASQMFNRRDKSKEVWNRLFIFENKAATDPVEKIPLIVPISIGRDYFMGFNLNRIPNAKNKAKILRELVKLQTTSNKRKTTNDITKALRTFMEEFEELRMIKMYKTDSKEIRQGRWASVSYQEALDHYGGY